MDLNLVHELPDVVDTDGTVYMARVLGGPAEDGTWEAVIEFQSPNGRLLWTPVETRQPNIADLVYWSTSLTPIYVEGALARADAETVATDLAAADWAEQERAQQRAIAALRRGITQPIARPVTLPARSPRSARSARPPRSARPARTSRVQRSVSRKPRARAGTARRP
jgi:hypothetical protein